MVRKIAEIFIAFGLFATFVFWWPWVSVPFEVPKSIMLGYFVKILAVIFVYEFLTKKNDWKINPTIFWWVCIFTIWAVITSFLGSNPDKSFVGNFYRMDGLLSLFNLVGLSILVSFFWNNSLKIKISFTFFITSLFLSLVALVEIFSQNFGLGSAATFGNPNFLAGFLSVTLPFSYYLFKINKKRYIFIIGIAINTLAILVIGAVSPILTLILYMSLVTLFYFRGKIKYLIVCLMILIAGYLTYDWVKSYSIENSQSFIAEGRLRIYRNILTGVSKRPLIGYGWANVDAAFESNIWPLKFNNDIYIDKAHSEMIEVVATTGFPGLIIYLILVGILLIKLIGSIKNSEDKNWDSTLLFVLVLYIFHSQTNVISIAEQVVFWLIVGILISDINYKHDI